jgi:hypothetical protein
MADLKTLQKKITTLLYTQLQQYFKQVQILSYKPSADGKVSGKFIGDRRNYSFILSNNQVQYLPSAQTKMDAALAIGSKGVVQCSGTNHPCKGEKGTRCVPDSQSCKQKESSPEGIARLKDISDTSKAITALVAPNALAKPNEKPSSPSSTDKAPELDQDISLYDFMKYYSPWRVKGSEGFDKAKLRDVKRPTKTKPKTEPKKEQPQPKSEPEAKPKEEPKKETTPYDFLGVNPKDFPDEASLYKASKTAYRNLAAKYHPDKGGDPKMMTELNNVMDKLKRMRSDSLWRRIYR